MSRDFDLFRTKESAIGSCKHAKASLLSHSGVIAITFVFLTPYFSTPLLMVWALCALAAALLDYFLNHDSQTVLTREKKGPLYHSRVGSSLLVGFMWGVVPLFFFTTQDTLYIIFIIAIYAGYISGALAVSFSYAPAFYAFTIGVSTPVAGRMFYEGGDPYTMIGSLMLFYICMLAYVAKNLDTLFIQSTRSKYDNEALIEDLAREKEAVEQAVKAKDRFLASASHDLRQPLNAVTLFVDALDPIQTKPLGNEIIGKIKLSLNSLNGMLHSMLDISRLDAQSVENIPKHICLRTLVTQLVQEYQDTKANHLSIEVDIESNNTVFVDPTLIYRIIRNLLDNAVKFTIKGSVFLSAKQVADSIEFTVQDTGIGIPEDKVSLIFDEFEQLNNPERNREKGLGLGLAIVKRLCNIATIELAINSTVGEGTRIDLLLPLGKPSQIITRKSHDNINLNDNLVVVIDDEIHILQATQMLLESWGCTVISVTSLATALDSLSKIDKVPDFIVSDFRLKGGAQGTDAIEIIRDEYNSEIPALLITGDTAPDRISALKDLDIKVIYKPFEADDLKRELIALKKQHPPHAT